MRSLLRMTLTAALAATLSMAMLASVAEARQFRMTGTWIHKVTPRLAIPLIGGADALPGAMASAIGSSPASFTVPTKVMKGVGAFIFPIPQSDAVQLSTMFTVSAPGATGNFSPGTKTSRPANFGWCLGAAANPNCTTAVVGGSQGSRPGLVRYTAGANQFGGTMQSLTVGLGSASLIVGTSPIRIQHNLLGGATGGLGWVGGPYANPVTNVQQAGPITSGAVCAGGPCGLAGLIIQPGTTTAGGTTTTNFNFGFPWTTGMVTVKVSTLLPLLTSTFTETGVDNRTALGSGQIVMVAGGLSFRQPSTQTFTTFDTVTLRFAPRNLPSMSPAGLAALAGLIAVGAGYAVRRRHAR